MRAVVYMVEGMFRETNVHPLANSPFLGLSGVVVVLDWLLGPQPHDLRAAGVSVPTGIAYRPVRAARELES